MYYILYIKFLKEHTKNLFITCSFCFVVLTCVIAILLEGKFYVNGEKYLSI